ncbi:hypothetical protein V1291_005421 [Nitrobacteraceae bacterium AZCC 1564]
MSWSDTKKNTDAAATMMKTITVVIMVSRRVGQTTLAVSERTSCRNLNGLVAIVCDTASVVPEIIFQASVNVRNPDSPLVRPTLF